MRNRKFWSVALATAVATMLPVSALAKTWDNVDSWDKLAEAFGGKGLRIKTRYDIEPVMKEAMHSDTVCVVDCWIDKDDCVYPIIPPGKGAKDIIIGN